MAIDLKKLEEFQKINNPLVNAVVFLYKLVVKDYLKLEEETNTLYDAMSKIAKTKVSNFDSLSDDKKNEEIIAYNDKSVYQKYLGKKYKMNILNNEINEIDDNYLFQIELLLKQNLPKNRENEQIKKIVEPLFKNYSITYDNRLTINGGESSFKRIAKSTESYEKMSDKMDQIEKKAAEIEIHNVMEPNKKLPKTDVDNFKKNNEILKKREETIQKIIMLKQNESVEKRVKKISKLESKRDYKIAKLNGKISNSNNFISKVTNKIISNNSYFDNLNNVLIENMNKKIDNLKTKEITAKGANRILFEQRIISMFTKKKYNKNGGYETRHWSARRLEELENKTGKSL